MHVSHIERGLASSSQTKHIVGVLAGARLLRDYLSGLSEPRVEVLCSVSDVAALGNYAVPQILLLDSQDATTATLSALRAFSATMKVIVINADANGLDLIECIRVGVVGFTVKDAGLDEIVGAIETVAANHRAVPAVIADLLCDQLYQSNRTIHSAMSRTAQLTFREQEIAERLAAGLTNKEIAQQLNIAPHTVKSHVHNILQKLDCRKRVDVAYSYLKYQPVGELRIY